MRARNLKPSLFKNEILGAADPLLTILFEGLWCEADREGRLEDRPLRLKAEIFPYRYDADVDGMLTWLAQNGFIARYEVNDTKIIQVLTFSDHQRPHKNEVSSVLPSMDAIKHNQGTKSAQPRKKALRSDSGSLTPDSGSLTPDPIASAAEPPTCDPTGTRPRKVSRESADPDWLLDFKLAYPDRAGDQGWRRAIRAGNERIREGHVPSEFIDGARRYAAFCQATGKANTEFVKQAASFLGPDKPFLLPWNLPNSRADTRLANNLSAAEEFMRRTEPTQ